MRSLQYPLFWIYYDYLRYDNIFESDLEIANISKYCIDYSHITRLG